MVGQLNEGLVDTFSFVGKIDLNHAIIVEDALESIIIHLIGTNFFPPRLAICYDLDFKNDCIHLLLI